MLSAQVTLEFHGKRGPLVCSGEGDSAFYWLCMPLQVSDPEAYKAAAA